MKAHWAIIILNYRTPDLTKDCLTSLDGNHGDGTQVIVVDNNSDDGSADIIENFIEEKGWSSWASVLRSPVNGGFAAGNNLGVRSIDADAYVLLNSDTIVREGAIGALQESMKARPSIGLMVPSLETRGGQLDQNTFRLIHPLSELVRLASIGPISRMLSRFDIASIPPGDRPLDPDWVGFACVVIRREVMDQIGLLDEEFFMYFEDVDYCRRATQSGWRIHYWPAARVVHLLGGSSGVTSEEKQQRRAPRYYYQARARYFIKYYGLSGLWLANLCWLSGRGLSSLRERVGGRAVIVRDNESKDIWIDALADVA